MIEMILLIISTICFLSMIVMIFVGLKNRNKPFRYIAPPQAIVPTKSIYGYQYDPNAVFHSPEIGRK